jgi:hypothetical protein
MLVHYSKMVACFEISVHTMQVYFALHDDCYHVPILVNMTVHIHVYKTTDRKLKHFHKILLLLIR